MTNILITFSYYLMTIGLLLCIFQTFKTKEYFKSLLLLLLPFYIFKYSLNLQDNSFKKYVCIAIMGGFVLFSFVKIFDIIFTVPI